MKYFNLRLVKWTNLKYITITVFEVGYFIFDVNFDVRRSFNWIRHHILARKYEINIINFWLTGTNHNQHLLIYCYLSYCKILCQKFNINSTISCSSSKYSGASSHVMNVKPIITDGFPDPEKLVDDTFSS